MQKYSRRSFLKMGFISAASNNFIKIRRANTGSGSPELTAGATIRADTSISIETREFLNGTNTQSVSIKDGINTYILDTLEGLETNTDEYEFNISLNSDTGVNTPELDFIVLTLPGESDGQDGGGGIDGKSKELWDTNIILFFVAGFLTIFYMIFGD